MAMRRQGYTLEDIADTLKCAVETVRTDLAEVLSRTASKMLETTEEMREQELDRYRSLLKFHQPLAEAGNLASAGLVITISREIRKLMAVDKPEEKREQESGIRVYVGINMEDV